jgi:uncharacterized protein (DUF3084 family)
MLLRISLIVAILAAVAVGVLNFVQIKPKIEALVTDRNNEKTQKEQAQNDLSKTRADLAKSEKELKTTKETLDETTQQRDRAVAEAAEATKKAADLTEKLAKTTEERNNAQAELAQFKATGRTPEQILAFDKTVKGLEKTIAALDDEKKLLNRELAKTQNELARYTNPKWDGPTLPANLVGKVTATDPKWDFVVINVGEDQGVLQHSRLYVSRDGKLVAKLRVTSVEKDRCIANVMDGWSVGAVVEGDAVIPVYPAVSSL